jgi:Methyltransferase domain
MIAFLVGFAGAWEAGWWAHRRRRRSLVYSEALRIARSIGRPLVVLGAPDSGSTAGYGCGDVTVDLVQSACPCSLRADVTKGLPFADRSVVVFASCVLEYVSDADAAIREIERVSGGYAYYVGVEPWTLAAYLYPGARRTLAEAYR